MKAIILVCILCITFPALATDIISCKSAAGYYGSVRIVTGTDVVITAEQMFADDLAGKLNLMGNAEKIILRLKPKDCRRSGITMKCHSGSASVRWVDFHGTTFSTMRAPVAFELRRVFEDGRNFEAVTLKIKDASQSVNFGDRFDQDGCRPI